MLSSRNEIYSNIIFALFLNSHADLVKSQHQQRLPLIVASSRNTNKSENSPPGASSTYSTPSYHLKSTSYFTPVVLTQKTPAASSQKPESGDSTVATLDIARAQLGRLDGVLLNGGSHNLSSANAPMPPTNIPKVRQLKDSKKIAAILLETNIVELQRHLLTITVQNQVSGGSVL